MHDSTAAFVVVIAVVVGVTHWGQRKLLLLLLCPRRVVQPAVAVIVTTGRMIFVGLLLLRVGRLVVHRMRGCYHLLRGIVTWTRMVQLMLLLVLLGRLMVLLAPTTIVMICASSTSRRIVNGSLLLRGRRVDGSLVIVRVGRRPRSWTQRLLVVVAGRIPARTRVVLVVGGLHSILCGFTALFALLMSTSYRSKTGTQAEAGNEGRGKGTQTTALIDRSKRCSTQTDAVAFL